MKTQTELLRGTSIASDELVGIEFNSKQLDFLAVAEGFAYNEWSKVCENIGVCATLDIIPENYDTVLQRAGKWTLDYPSASEM